MNKRYLIILTLVASAHVHGMDQNPDKNNDASRPQNNRPSILGKRTKQRETGSETQNKRQKTTNQATVEQSNALSDSLAEQSDTLIKTDARTTREALNNQMPEKKMYCEKTGKWVELKRSIRSDNADGCFVYSSSTLYVPNKPDVFATLKKIISKNNIGQKVNHVIIDLPKLEVYANQWPYGSSRIINKLFTDNENNSVTFKVVTTDTQDFDFDGEIDAMMHNLSNVKHLIFKGETGNEQIELVVPVNMGNQSVTMQNAKRCNLGIADGPITEPTRSLTTVNGSKSQIIIKGNGPLGSTIVAKGANSVQHSNTGEFYVEAKGKSEFTIENGTLEGTATDGMVYKDYYTKSMETLHYLTTEGPSKFTIAQGKVTTASNDGAKCLYKPNADNEHYDKAVAKGKSEFTIENGTLEGTATDGMVFENYYIAFCYGLNSMETLHRLTTEGQSKFTIAQGKVTTQSNDIAAYFYKPKWLDSEGEQLNVSEQVKQARAEYTAEAKGDKSKVILESNGTTTASSDCHVDHFRASPGGNILYSGEAVGTNAMIRVEPSGRRTLKGDTHVEQSDHEKGRYPAYQTARAEGPNSQVVMAANGTGKAESDGYAWYEKNNKYWSDDFFSHKAEAKGKAEGKEKAEISFETQRNDNTTITKLSASGKIAQVRSQKHGWNKDFKQQLLQDSVAEGTNVQFIDKEDNAIEFKSNKNVSGKEYNADGVLSREVDVQGSDATLIIEKDGTQTLESNYKAMFIGYNKAKKVCKTILAEDGEEQDAAERVKPKIIIKDNEADVSGTIVMHDNDGAKRHPTKPFLINGHTHCTIAL